MSVPIARRTCSQRHGPPCLQMLYPPPSILFSLSRNTPPVPHPSENTCQFCFVETMFYWSYLPQQRKRPSNNADPSLLAGDKPAECNSTTTTFYEDFKARFWPDGSSSPRRSSTTESTPSPHHSVSSVGSVPFAHTFRFFSARVSKPSAEGR